MRRPRLRQTEVACPGCGDQVEVRFELLTYVRLTREREDGDRLHEVRCGGCGGWVPVTVGDARRAA